MGEFFDQSPRQQDDPAIREPERPHLGAVEALLLPAPRRVASVDALRGFTMFWIMGADGCRQGARRNAVRDHMRPAFPTSDYCGNSAPTHRRWPTSKD